MDSSYFLIPEHGQSQSMQDDSWLGLDPRYDVFDPSHEELGGRPQSEKAHEPPDVSSPRALNDRIEDWVEPAPDELFNEFYTDEFHNT
jgi:hypothetical protein